MSVNSAKALLGLLCLLLCAKAVLSVESLRIDVQNMLEEQVDIYWMDPNDYKRVLITSIEPLGTQGLNTYEGHAFKAVAKKKNEDISTIYVEKDKTLYHVDKVENRKFREDYYHSTKKEWINTIPREETSSFIYPTPQIGFKYLVNVYPPHWRKGQPEVVQPKRADFFPKETQYGFLEVKSLSPKILFIEDFLSDDECQHVIDVMTPSLKRSTVSNKAILDENRTSRTTWIEHNTDPVIQNVIQRAFNLMKIPYFAHNSSRYAESLQGLHYGKEQWYREHYDYFGPAEYLNDPHIQAGNNRLATLFLYLSDVAEGGETYFPRFGGNYIPNGCQNPNCFKVRPVKGGAVIFYSMLEDGNLDFDSLHGGCPVIKGNKYAANLWFWDRVFRH